MADILISASLPDRDAAERLSHIFEARGLSVDWMPLNPAEPGNKAGILGRRAGARITVALWSNHSVSDAQVLEDAREALRRGSLLAARLEDVTPPPEFRACPTANLAGWDGSDSHIQAGRLLTETAKLLERPSTRAALAMATARLTRSGGGGAAAALRVMPPAAPVSAAFAKAEAPVLAAPGAPEMKPEVKSAEEIAPAPQIAPEAVAAAAEPPRPQAETAPEGQGESLALTPAPVKTADSVSEQKLEARPAPVLFAGEPANDALPLRPAKITVAEGAPIIAPQIFPVAEKPGGAARIEDAAPAAAPEPTYQTITFEPEPRPAPKAAPEPAPAAEPAAKALAPEPAPSKTDAPRRPAAKSSGKRFLRETRERTKRDDRNHIVAIALGLIAGAGLLALWANQRPQDFQLRAVQKAPAELSAPAAHPRPEDAAPAPAITETEHSAPIEPAPLPQIAIESDLPLLEPAPQTADAAPPAALEPSAPPAVVRAPETGAPFTAQAPAPAFAQKPALAEKPGFTEPSTIRERASAKPRAAGQNKSTAGPSAQTLKAKRLAAVGRALDARAAQPAQVIAALAGAAPAASQAPQSLDPFDAQLSQTALQLGSDEPAFHLPGLAPSMLGAWAPEPPAPGLSPPVADAQWNAQLARVLAQSALDHGSYKDHLAKAQAGDRRAMMTLGLMRQTGIGEARDDAKAFAWLRRSALAGEPRALAEIGAYYAAGIGAARDDARAARNFDRSATLGAAAGKNAFGWALATGRGVPANPAMARIAFQEAADAGDPLAALNLGRMQADGMGGVRDLAAAKLSYGKAADQGFAPAQYALAILMLADRSAAGDEAAQNARAKSENLAALRLQQAAAQGYPPAQSLLGALYRHGIGVAQDDAMARAWFAKASRT